MEMSGLVDLGDGPVPMQAAREHRDAVRQRKISRRRVAHVDDSTHALATAHDRHQSGDVTLRSDVVGSSITSTADPGRSLGIEPGGWRPRGTNLASTSRSGCRAPRAGPGFAAAAQSIRPHRSAGLSQEDVFWHAQLREEQELLGRPCDCDDGRRGETRAGTTSPRFEPRRGLAVDPEMIR